ncbi:thiazole biosynthesis protein [Candidatus Sumerlaeota bacterium]|nr:thiazole biosynthesis protein [Candidatus Sumerlaeota bacterium]
MGIFTAVSESEVTRAIVQEFDKFLSEFAITDCIIIGAGPSGLMAARDLALGGIKVLLIERNNYLGGGFWSGGYLMNKLTVRHPGEEILNELGVPFIKFSEGLYVADAPHACSRLIASALDAGAKVLNMTSFEDIVIGENDRARGVVVNWASVRHLPKEVNTIDPIALESETIVDATGHDAVVFRKLEKHGLFTLKGEGALWINRSEDAVVEYTKEAYPGVFCTGMAVAAVYGLPRMGPTFGGMLLSGRRVAEQIIAKLKK